MQQADPSEEHCRYVERNGVLGLQPDRHSRLVGRDSRFELIYHRGSRDDVSITSSPSVSQRCDGMRTHHGRNFFQIRIELVFQHNIVYWL